MRFVAGIARTTSSAVASAPAMIALRMTQPPPRSTRKFQGAITKPGTPNENACIRGPMIVSRAGMTTTAPPIASAEHSVAPMPREIRIVFGPISGVRARATTSAVPPMSTARPVVSIA